MKQVVILFFLSILFQNQVDTIPKLDLRDGTLNLELNIPSVIPDARKEDAMKLTDLGIDEIKNIAKNFKASQVSEDDVIIISTNKGDIKFKFYNNEAPNHCYNFKKLANSGFYDETLFHRVVKDFIIQGGDILSRDSDPGNDGTGGPGWTIDAEFNKIKHSRGILSMARGDDVNSAGSQFFIALDSHSHLDNKYTVFGYIIEGDYVLDLISKITTEYDQAMMLTRKSIPGNEDFDNWIEVYDHHTKQKLFSKVPEYISKQSYRKAINKKIKNIHKPGIPIIIESIRVVNPRVEKEHHEELKKWKVR